MRGQDKHIGDNIPSHHSATIDEDQIRAVYQLMYRYVGNREDAESLTERACTQALRNAWGLPGGRGLEEILWETAESVAAEHLRRVYGSFEQPDKETPAREQRTAPTLVRCILESLTGQERDFLARRFLDNGSLAETAATLHLTVNEALALQWYALTQAAQIAPEETPCCSPC
jgi:DNA-directed RNA polymerase specialized sigma24 family protein